jgi:hypothetical protein
MFRCLSCATVWETGQERCPFCGGLRVDRAYAPPVHGELLRERVLTHLRPLTDRLVASLAEIARKEVSEEAYLIEFEAHFNFFAKRFPIRWDALDETNSQLEEEDGGYVLGPTEPAFPKELFECPEAEGVDMPDFCYRLIEAWIAEAWDRAGGAECKYPAYIRFHGSSVTYGLRQRRMVRDSERWPKEE